MLTLEILYNNADECQIISGGDSSNPTWEKYLSGFYKEFHPHLELVKTAILDYKNGLYQITGEEKQNLGVSFKFSDGTHISFTWRGWGDLMQAIVNKREGYMRYYM